MRADKTKQSEHGNYDYGANELITNTFYKYPCGPMENKFDKEFLRKKSGKCENKNTNKNDVELCPPFKCGQL